MSRRGQEFHPPIGEMDAATDSRGSSEIDSRFHLPETPAKKRGYAG
jgi:hypothetical protein